MKCPKCLVRIELGTTACEACDLDLTEDRILRESRKIAKFGRWALLVVAVLMTIASASGYVLGRDLLDTQISRAKADRWNATTDPERLEAAKDRTFMMFVALLIVAGLFGIAFMVAPYRPFWALGTASAVYVLMAAVSFVAHAVRGEMDNFCGPQIICFVFVLAAYHARRFEQRLAFMANDWVDTPPPGPAASRR